MYMRAQLTVLLTSLLGACGADPAGSGSGEASTYTPRLCEPGTFSVCACPDGPDGLQECLPSGAERGPCDCDTNDPAGTTATTAGNTTGSGTGDTTGADDEPINAILLGSVEKGPFVIGSSVLVSEVDALGLPTGRIFPTFTMSDLGEFDVVLDDVENVSMEASGYYYNEAVGKVSASPITLRAFYAVSANGQQQARVNLLTHLASQRVLALAQDGLGLAEAVVQAQDELVLALEVGAGLTIESPAASLSVVGPDSLGNAYLLAVSSVVAEAARLAAATPDDVWGGKRSSWSTAWRATSRMGASPPH